MLAPLRDNLRPEDPTSSPLLCATKECYLRRLSARVNPGEPGYEEARWITSEDANIEHLLGVFTSVDANLEAQTFIDAIYNALDLLDFPPPLWRKWLRTLHQICGRYCLLPASLQIPLCYNRLDAPLYMGRYANVWKGKHEGRDVAVKVLRIHTTGFDDVMSIFCKVAVTWKLLRHPNVLPTLGVIVGDHNFAVVSDWMANGDINEFIKAHGNVNRFELLKDVASGLMYMHGQGIIHGDLKGANILIDQNGRARLADFGLVNIAPDPTDPATPDSSAAGGTTRWMSPELLHPDLFGIKHSQATKESDYYALGMVIYEVLTGQVPFAPYNNFIIRQKVIEGYRPERPEGVKGKWFVGNLWEVLEMCWAAQPESRPSIEAVFECLEQASTAWKPPLPQADGGVEEGEDYLDLTSNDSSETTWSTSSIRSQ